MEIAPFKIKQMTLDSARLRVKTQSVKSQENVDAVACDAFPAYLVVSTAPHNIDEAIAAPTVDSVENAKQGLSAIARHLHRIQCDPTITEPPELVVAVHGYNTAEKGIKAWYSDIYRYIAQDDQAIRQRRNLVFIGYRWSSERVSVNPRHLWRNLRALPDVPQALLGMGLAFMLTYWGWALLWEPLWQNDWANLLGAGFLSLSVAITVMISTLLLLRTTVYFRDVYRAINFGVPDLTELIRQIDQAVVDLRVADLHQRYPDYGDAMRQAKRIASGQTLADGDGHEKIKLNFLGHSMGGLVITNVVRILSDVFDRRSISRNPIPDIGNTLSLGRLILASPDVPVLSIISSRSNGLASSLRRFQEAYLFSNEGDLALRLASTAANYISFPSARQHHGHRLGSVALTKTKKQGLINLDSLERYYPIQRPLGQGMAEDDHDILNSLYITHSVNKSDADNYLSLGELFSREHAKLQRASLADLFTFFDCTDYKDYRLVLRPNGKRDRTKEKTGLLTRAKHKDQLSLFDYIELAFDCLRGRLDVHGGYFHGEYSRQLMYRLAFLGFEGMLNAIAVEAEKEEALRRAEMCGTEMCGTEMCGTEMSSPEMNGAESSSHGQSGFSLNTRVDALDALDSRCAEKGIQVYLSPLRYRVDVQGADLNLAKEEMMRVVQPKSKAAMASAARVTTVDVAAGSGSGSADGQSADGQSAGNQSVPLLG